MTLSFRPRCVLAVAVSLAFVMLTQTAGAQVLYGSMVGNVHDSTGAMLPGATVVIVHEETRLTREATTDSAGTYTFTAVPTGTYTVKVTLTGFRTLSLIHI